jgi:hypothetical protein
LIIVWLPAVPRVASARFSMPPVGVVRRRRRDPRLAVAAAAAAAAAGHLPTVSATDATLAAFTSTLPPALAVTVTAFTERADLRAAGAAGAARATRDIWATADMVGGVSGGEAAVGAGEWPRRGMTPVDRIRAWTMREKEIVWAKDGARAGA